MKKQYLLKKTGKENIRKVESQILSPPEILEKDTPKLEGIFVASVYTSEKYLQLESQFSKFGKVLKRTSETGQLFWHEYNIDSILL